MSPKQKVALRLKRKRKISSNVVDFVFKPPHQLAFAPGQYMEFTLAHPKPDSRGNRRYFTLPRDPRQKLVFMAGGIGITPFRSMLKYLLDINERRDYD